MSHTSHRRRALAAAATALLVLAPSAPAAHRAHLPGPPNYPSAVASQPGALTGTHVQTPSDVNAALAQERYYSSYGDPASDTSPAVRSTERPSGNGIGSAPLVVSLLAALALGIGAVRAMHVRRARRPSTSNLA
jgi:hypothetical protein